MDYQESVAGFKRRGGWVDVVEHGERVTQALWDLAGEADVAEVDEEALEAFEEWRPKSHERLDEDVSQKTAEQARVEEGAGEKAGKGPDEDLRIAGEKLADSYESLDEPDDAVDAWSESIDYVARAADSAGRKAIRAVEDTVYRSVMTQIAPYYFDNELVSANVARTGDDEAPFTLEINVNDDAYKAEVSDRLDSFTEEIDRWHVDAEKRTENAKAAEGVDPPDTESDADARTT
jgi:hypothetical protein